MGARVCLGLSGSGCSGAGPSGLGLWVLALGLAFLVTLNAGASDGAAHSERQVATPENRREKLQRRVKNSLTLGCKGCLLQI